MRRTAHRVWRYGAGSNLSEINNDTRYLVFYNTSPPRMFLSLDLLWEYRIQHGANGPLYVTSSYPTWIFCRGVSGFATDCPCGVWCRACWSTFWKSNFKQQLGCRFDIMDNESYFFLFWHMQLYMSWYIRSFLGLTFFMTFNSHVQ